MAGRIVTKRGDTLTLAFMWKESNNGPPLPLTGCTARQHLRKTDKLSAGVVVELSSGDGGIVISEADGKAVVTFSASDMSIEKGDYVTDQEMTFPDGKVLSSKTVDIRLEQDITYG